MLFPATPVVPRTTDGLQEFEDVLVEPCAPQRPVQRLPEKVCLSPTRGVLPAGHHAPTITRPGSCKLFSTTPVVTRRTGESGIVVDVLKETCAPPRPVQHLPKENCLSPLPGPLLQTLLATNHASTHRPTRSLWTTPHRCGQHRQMGSSVGGVVPHMGALTYVACRDNSTSTTVQTTTNALAGLDKMTFVKRATRRGKTRTGGCRSCTLMGWFLFAAMLLMVDVVGAVFAPANSAALKAAVGTCLSETADGSCPTLAASDATPGNSYGVIGDWDVSAVTSMLQSKCTLPLCGHTSRCCAF